jgi:hypothetical protein
MVANVQRRTWDLDEYKKKAQEKQEERQREYRDKRKQQNKY